jgi:hypothetical protein
MKDRTRHSKDRVGRRYEREDSDQRAPVDGEENHPSLLVTHPMLEVCGHPGV